MLHLGYYRCLFLNNNLSVLTVLHLTQLPASVLMVHNHRPFNATASWRYYLYLNSNLSAVMVQHLTPLPASVLMVHNHRRFNATAPGVTTAEQQLVCADGTAPDPTTGLCADGSQPQAISMLHLLALLLLNSNLSAADDTAPDVTTGLCADGSQPQAIQCYSSFQPLLLFLNNNLSVLMGQHLINHRPLR